MTNNQLNVAEFPAREQEPRTSDSITIMLVSGQATDAAVVQHIFSGSAPRKTRVCSCDAAEIPRAIAEWNADLVLVRDHAFGNSASRLHELIRQVPGHVPVIVLGDKTSVEDIDRYIRAGAKDVLSVGRPKHMRAVAERELANLSIYRKLEHARRRVALFEARVKRLSNAGQEGVADVRDGMIVGVNTSWIRMFESSSSRALISTPVADLIGKPDQARLHDALQSCARQESRRHVVELEGVTLNGVRMQLHLVIKRVRVNGVETQRIIARREDRDDARTQPGIDPVLGIFDRSNYIERLFQRIDTPLNGGTRAMVYLRPDRFSAVQEWVGVLGSEEALAHIANVISELAHPADLYGRLGGTVLGIMVERGSVREIEAWVKHCCHLISTRPFQHNGRIVELNCSVGISEVRNSKMTLDELLVESHDACQLARLDGGNGVQWSKLSLAARQQQEVSSKEVQRIRAALQHNRFRLVRAPIVSLTDKDLKMRDALLRMEGEDGEDILPSGFIPAAEEAGLMRMLDRWVIGASMTYAAKRKPDLIFIRLSEDSVVDDSLTGWLQRMLETTGASARQVCFQVAEDVAANSLSQVVWQVQRLSELGFSFAVDQVGTTDDTLKILQHVPMQHLRIDAGLLQGLARDEEVQRRVAGIVRIAAESCIQTIGNRIEDAATMAAACEIGLDFAQGEYVEHDEIVLEDTLTLCQPKLPGIVAI